MLSIDSKGLPRLYRFVATDAVSGMKATATAYVFNDDPSELIERIKDAYRKQGQPEPTVEAYPA